MHSRKLFGGGGLRALALRGTAITLGGTASQQMLRLLSNLILTRLLFPEAFGMMALVQSFTAGLQMFSDLGLRPSIIQSKRGEDPDFLNTAWTIQIIRGVALWLFACLLAWPLARFYGEEQILWLLPVVGLNALITGFYSTKGIVANRKLLLGRQTVIALVCQVIGLTAMIAMALTWPSVWSLVLGGLVSSLIGVWANHRFIPGMSNRLRWEPTAVRELIGFGRFIFLSTMATYVVAQGDRLFLGRTISLADLGIYNVAFFLGAFPGMLAGMVANQILFPLYRQLPPGADRRNFAKIRKARDLVTSGQMVLYTILGLAAVPLVHLMYDDRYAAAGPMLVVLALAQLPGTVLIGSSRLLLAVGDSRRFSRLEIYRGFFTLAFMVGAFWLWGIFGVLVMPALLFLVTYPLQQSYLARYDATDIPRDAAFLALSALIIAAAVWFNWDSLAEFYQTSRMLAPSVTGSWEPKDIFAR
ncbi:oligosaccharide flippase family protein [Paracoccus aestuarii]|uniref:oligosaccharide flippase family protein n=1 Tax=Paracoccus aestuarii TaxID=453842 RepID=UPI00147499A9|nr:oligosaccharide flippase family protein [Paracoccus aestuarii]